MTTPIFCWVQKSISANKGSAVGFSGPWLKRLSLLIGLALLTVSLTAGCFSGRGAKSRPSTKYPLSGKSYVINGQRYHILASANGYQERGQASWYGEPFHGRKTANGETYDMHRISAAHKTLPLNTWVEVHNLDNHKKMTVRINDRGPFIEGRIIDLSLAAAKELGLHRPGLARVMVTAITDAHKIDQLKAAENRASGQAVKAAANKKPAADGSKPATSTAARKPASPAPTAPAKAAAGAAKKPAATAKSSAAPAAGKSYLVYVTRTPDPDKAQTLAGKIGQKFAKVKIRVSYEQGQPYFQVRVEGFNGFNQAKAAQTKLAKLGYTEASVISN